MMSIILLFDQKKAFDREEWTWLYKVLKQFNFGERFIGWMSFYSKKLNNDK